MDPNRVAPGPLGPGANGWGVGAGGEEPVKAANCGQARWDLVLGDPAVYGWASQDCRVTGPYVCRMFGEGQGLVLLMTEAALLKLTHAFNIAMICCTAVAS
jgi:hypothetical protein